MNINDLIYFLIENAVTILVIAFVVSLVMLLVAIKRMKTVSKAYYADWYLIRNTIMVRPIYDRYITTHVTREYSPEKKDDNNGHGPGGGPGHGPGPRH